MKFSLATAGVYGVAITYAGVLPDLSKAIQKPGDLVPLTDYLKFPFHEKPFEEAKAEAEASNSTEHAAAKPQSKVGKPVIKAGAKCPNGQPPTRYEWRNMPDDKKKAFIDALLVLYNKPSDGTHPGAKTRFDDLVSVHQVMRDSIHSTAFFLPWHRWYIAVFENVLQTECGYDGNIPWWNEPTDAKNFAGAPMFVEEYLGTANVRNNGQATCISGRLSAITANIGPDVDNGPHCISRAVNEEKSSSVTHAYEDLCHSKDNFQDMATCNERGVHAYGHNGVGGVMEDVPGSPADPIFFMHHAYLDRLWRKWQMGDFNNRGYQVNGYLANGQPLTLDTVISTQGLRPDATVRDVMNSWDSPYFCYRYDDE